MDKNSSEKNPTQPGAKPDQKQKELPPTPGQIGPYKIESLLAKGGMSLLYLGTHPETKAPVVVKVLSPKYLSRQEVVERFLNEAEIIAMADHPHIVKLFGHGEWEGGLYIAMEFIEGISLRQYLLQTPLSLKRALEIVLDIAHALGHLHSHGVIHRDLKPENILVEDSGEIKVIDFGIAQLLAEKESEEAIPKRRLIGTPIYISPEQRENAETASFPSDIYSLGIITYELLLGKLSHGRIHLSLMPKGMQKVLYKSLQPKPDDRYQDIVDFISDISNYMNSEAIEKEKNVEDQLSELSEDLRHIQEQLVPIAPPDWEGIEIGIDSQKGASISGVYYDFFDLGDGRYGIVLCESSSKGAEGVICTSVLRGMIRGLYRFAKSPDEMVTLLNDLLVDDHLGPIFSVNYLILDPKENQLIFSSCGYNKLWRLKENDSEIYWTETDNNALGIESDVAFNEAKEDWNQGDTLVLNTFATIRNEDDTDAPFTEELFKQALHEYAESPPQKQVENILRKSRTLSKRPLQERPIVLISIRRG